MCIRDRGYISQKNRGVVTSLHKFDVFFLAFLYRRIQKRAKGYISSVKTRGSASALSQHYNNIGQNIGFEEIKTLVTASETSEKMISDDSEMQKCSNFLNKSEGSKSPQTLL